MSVNKFFRTLAGLAILALALRWLSPSAYAWMIATVHMIVGVIRQ